MNRRKFLATSTTAALAPLVLPSGRLFGAEAPSNKLNLALLGAYGRGHAHWDVLATQNVVALCDVNEKHLALAGERFPAARRYVDWRECLEHPDLDGVVVCTLDHTHAMIALRALKRNLHIYLEKPLAITVEEARLVRAAWLERRDRVATQVGTQRHAHPNFNRIRELIRDGAIGELEEACAWGDRQYRRKGYPPAQGEPPPELHYDLWLGPASYHPYNPEYFAGGVGMNCLQWNMYWDFGAGQVGDMGAHTMDLVWNAIDATHPTSAEATGEPFNPEVTPVELAAHFEHPANDWRPAIKVSWYQGGLFPESPLKWVDLRKIGHGALFSGTRGYLVCDFTNRLLIPLGPRADFTYYRRRAEADVLPTMKGFVEEWFAACRDPKRIRTSCDFDYSGLMTEQQMLGLAAYRAGKKLAYDGKTGRVTNDESANQFLRRNYRDGWPLQA
ncbi:MAG: Gfo/Idh/MocA family protein [Limisphaerales bacterium]